MIVVDTSVWVASFRGEHAATAELRRLLDADLVALVQPVRLEILEGSRQSELGRLRRLLGALPVYVPNDACWSRAESWIDRAKPKGHRFGIVDLLIAATAAEHHASVWSLDTDFTRMARLRFIKVHSPRARRR